MLPGGIQKTKSKLRSEKDDFNFAPFFYPVTVTTEQADSFVYHLRIKPDTPKFQYVPTVEYNLEIIHRLCIRVAVTEDIGQLVPEYERVSNQKYEALKHQTEPATH